jgi:hypothetical protein
MSSFASFKLLCLIVDEEKTYRAKVHFVLEPRAIAQQQLFPCEILFQSFKQITFLFSLLLNVTGLRCVLMRVKENVLKNQKLKQLLKIQVSKCLD